jgi:uncharacterized protein YjcR
VQVNVSADTQAFGLFLAGHSLRTIAAQLGLSRSTVERFSRREQWVDQRAVTWHQRKQARISEHIQESKHSSMALSGFIFDQMMNEIGWYKAVAKGDAPRKARKFSPRDGPGVLLPLTVLINRLQVA